MAPEPFEFLGYRFERGGKWPRERSMAKLRRTIVDKTPRRDGRSFPVIIADVNSTLRGWFVYFKHSHRAIFREVAQTPETQRPRPHPRRSPALDNAFFAEQGLYSLTESRLRLVQAAKAAH